MKYLNIILRIVLGLPFLIFGLNKFFGFIEMPPMSGPAGEFMGILFQSGYLQVVGMIEIVSGLFLISGFFVPLALVLIFPVNVNIILFHLLLTQGAGIGLALVLCIVNIVLMFRYLPTYRSMLSKKTSM